MSALFRYVIMAGDDFLDLISVKVTLDIDQLVLSFEVISLIWAMITNKTDKDKKVTCIMQPFRAAL